MICITGRESELMTLNTSFTLKLKSFPPMGCDAEAVIHYLEYRLILLIFYQWQYDDFHGFPIRLRTILVLEGEDYAA